MEQLEEEEMKRAALQPKKEAWIGVNKEAEKPAPTGFNFRDTPISFTNSKQTDAKEVNGIKFAPINDGGMPLAPPKTDDKPQNNEMFAPLDKPKEKSSRRMDDDDGLVFVSKEERERRRLKK